MERNKQGFEEILRSKQNGKKKQPTNLEDDKEWIGGRRGEKEEILVHTLIVALYGIGNS